MKRLTAEWVRKAESDHLAARRLARGKLPLPDAVCFHCQQCAEKYLKALLVELAIPVPRTHNLVGLLPLLVPQNPGLRRFRRGLDFLTRFAVETRYPGDSATRRQMKASLRWSLAVRKDCRAILIVRTRRRRSGKP